MKATWRYWFPISRERFWPYASDTDRINRAAGLPPVTYRPEPTAAGPPLIIATARQGPLRVVWVEQPFTWEVPARLAIAREFREGPFARLTVDVRFSEENGGTRVEHSVEITPKNALGALLLPLVMANGAKGTKRAYEAAFAAAQVAGTPPPVSPKAKTLAQRMLTALEGERRLGGRLEAIKAAAPSLAAYLESAEERDVARMRPYAVADAVGVERHTMLALMLALTRAGLLDLSWDVVCPACKGPRGRFDLLEGLQGAVHCEMCNVTYDSNFDRNVEVTFSAAPLGRGIDVPTFCALGPHENRQSLAQTLLAPGARATLAVDLLPGAYAFEVPPGRSIRFTVEESATAHRLEVTLLPEALRLNEAALAPGRSEVVVTSAVEQPALVRVAESAETAIATAADVTALQEFRDLFSSEVLASGLELSIRAMTIVFTDLVGSTHLYTTTGDAPAFRLVTEHFDQLRELIARYRGAIVKTIGDAVMAVFTDPADAYDAAVQFARVVGIVQAPRGPLEIRVGMHSGPCIAMRANDKLDYFGSTVNLAARIGHIGRAGEVVLSEEMLTAHPRIAARVSERAPARESVRFKGFEAPVGVVRIPADPLADAQPVVS